ncbi:MAG TPA: hypothetical protein VLB09_06925, partial [Nitrospiria bacterium]|nr:hypothetical protein [Nitrospiria bacterium]
ILDSSRSATLGGPLCRTDAPAAVSVSPGTSVILVMAAVADAAIKDTQTIRYREVGTAGWINLSTVSSPLRTTASTVLANGQTDVTLSEAVIAANTGSVCNVDDFDGGVYINGIEIENSDASWFAADPDWEVAGSDFTENHIAIVDDGSLGADTTFEFQWRQVDDGSNLFIGNRRLTYTVAPPTSTTTSTTSTTSTTTGGPTSSTTTSTTSTTSTTTSTTSTTTSTTLIGPARTTIGTGVDPISISVLPGETNRAADAFTVFTNTGTDTITFIAFTFQGTIDGDKDVDPVKIYRDNGSAPSEYDAGDTLIATEVFSSGVAEFSGLNIPVTTTPVQYLVTFDIVNDPVEGNTLGGAVTAA